MHHEVQHLLLHKITQFGLAALLFFLRMQIQRLGVSPRWMDSRSDTRKRLRARLYSRRVPTMEAGSSAGTIAADFRVRGVSRLNWRIL